MRQKCWESRGFKFLNLSVLLYFDNIFAEVGVLGSLEPYVKKGVSTSLEEKIKRERAGLFNSGSLEKMPELVQEMEEISGTFSFLKNCQNFSNTILKRMVQNKRQMYDRRTDLKDSFEFES